MKWLGVAREGEQVGGDGLLELGRTGSMFAIAEVYEDDIGRVRAGQRARITSPALSAPLSGTVDWIHLKVAKQDALGTDPAARKDARVVEVEVRLDDSAAAAALTNLQVEVEFEP
jgi:HlyD family secretion protein